MWTSNDFVQLGAEILIFINILVGLLLVGYGLYVVFLPWGDAESYQAAGICMTLFGVAFTCGSVYGMLAVMYQLRRFGGGYTGRTAIMIYQCLLLALLIALIVAYESGNGWLQDMKSAADVLSVNPTATPSYSSLESLIRDRFNKLFFTATETCKSEYRWFWSFVQKKCPATMSPSSCERCNSYSATFCSAYEPLCYESNQPPGEGKACPYVICREGTLTWVTHIGDMYFGPVVATCLAITLVLLVLCTYLVCHNQTRKVVVKVMEGGVEIPSRTTTPVRSPVDNSPKFNAPSAPTPSAPLSVPKPMVAPLSVTIDHHSQPPSQPPTLITLKTLNTPCDVVPVHQQPGSVPKPSFIPPPIYIEQSTLDVDTENAIIDSFIAASRDENNHIPAHHHSAHHSTVAARQSTVTTEHSYHDNYAVLSASADHRDQRFDSYGGNGGRRDGRGDGRGGGRGSYVGNGKGEGRGDGRGGGREEMGPLRPYKRSPRHGEGYSPVPSQHQMQYQDYERNSYENNHHYRDNFDQYDAAAYEYSDHRHVPRSPLPVAEDVQLEIALMESLESNNVTHTHNTHTSHATQNHSSAHSTHNLSTHNTHTTTSHHTHSAHSNSRARNAPLTPAQEHYFHTTPLVPTSPEPDVQMEIAMMESLSAQSREDIELERALFESVHRKKAQIGIPTNMGTTPLHHNRLAPRFETARATEDSALDQAILQSILDSTQIK